MGAADTSEPKVLGGDPGGLTTLAKAALPALPGINQLPGVKKVSPAAFTGLSFTRTDVEVRREETDAYAAVCGFPAKDSVPVPYPHMLAFPLHMAIMSDPGFPYPAIGMVHVENAITQHRPVLVGENLDITTSVSTARPHPKGALLDFVTTVSADDELVWDSVSTYLRRGKPPAGEPAEGLRVDDAPGGSVEWSLPANLGRSYAAVSGDANPIHLYPLTAKALGFPRQIAHGMWTMARCVAAIENRLPDAVTVSVAFKKPVFLPGRVSFGVRQDGGSFTFSLTSPKDGSPHLVGTATPA